jgi:hypothetical protein
MGDPKDPKTPEDLPPAATRSSDPRPNYRQGPGSIGNTVGLVTPKPSPNGSIRDGQPTAPTDPTAKPETPHEQSFWSKVSGTVHAGVDVLGFVPGLGAIPDLVNAGLYGLEGDVLAAMTSAVAAIPGAGDAAKAGTMIAKGGKAIEKEAAREAGDKAGKEAAERVEREAAERALQERAEGEAAGKGRKEAAEAGGVPPRQDGGYSKGERRRNPCEHPNDLKKKRKYVVYRAAEFDDAGQQIGTYVGRTSGAPGADTLQILKRREVSHHRNVIGLEPIFETDSYAAARGAEHLYRNKYGTSKQINPISSRNKRKSDYLDCAKSKGAL